MRPLFTLLAFIFLSSLSYASEQACVYKDASVKVIYEHEQDYKNTCVALQKLYDFTTNTWGFKLNTTVPTIVFMDNVLLPKETGSLEGTRVFGFFNGVTKHVEMTTSTTNWVNDPDRTFFTLRYSNEFHTSVIAHELAHAFNKEQYTTSRHGHATDEYMAYVIQLSILSENTRNQILNLPVYKNEFFTDKATVNDFVHAVNPHAFGVQSYKHYHSDNGGIIFIQEILKGDYTGELMDM